MNTFWRDLAAVFIVVGIFCAGALFGATAGRPPKPPLEVRYEAYRECIPVPGCMSIEDYIDYYELKWELESKPDIVRNDKKEKDQ